MTRGSARLAPLPGSDGRDGEGERPWWRRERASEPDRTLLQSKHLLVVPVRLEEGVSARFALDSGAAYSLVQQRGESAMSIRQVSLQGLSGLTALGEVLRPVRLELPGGRRAVLREAVYADLSEVSAAFGLPLDGFLGFPALRRLVTTIDLRSGSLLFQ